MNGGLYRCDDCGHTVKVTEVRHLWNMSARMIDRDTCTARCPVCCPLPRSDPKANRRNTFRRMGMWDTFKWVLGQWKKEFTR